MEQLMATISTPLCEQSPLSLPSFLKTDTRSEMKKFADTYVKFNELKTIRDVYNFNTKAKNIFQDNYDMTVIADLYHMVFWNNYVDLCNDFGIEDVEGFTKIIYDNNMYISGSFILQVVLGEKFKNSYVRDIDVFCDVLTSKAKNDLEYFFGVAFEKSKDDSKYTNGSKNSKKFRLNNMYLDSRKKIQVIETQVNAIESINGFDIDACKIWFDGYTFSIAHITDVVNKQTKYNYFDGERDFSYIAMRIRKHVARGFEFFFSNTFIEKMNDKIEEKEAKVICHLNTGKSLTNLFKMLGVAAGIPYDSDDDLSKTKSLIVGMKKMDFLMSLIKSTQENCCGAELKKEEMLRFPFEM